MAKLLDYLKDKKSVKNNTYQSSKLFKLILDSTQPHLG